MMEFPFGQYEFQEINEVIQFDLPYCKWVLNQSNIQKKYPEFYEQLQQSIPDNETHSQFEYPSNIMPFGKHCGLPYEEIIFDEYYCKWLLKKDSFEKEYPKHKDYLQKLYELVYFQQEDSKFFTFYVLFFKNADYIKIGKTKQYIVKRLYNYQGVLTLYFNDNFDLDKSYVVRTNYSNIEKDVLKHFAKYRLDSKSERLLKTCEDELNMFLQQLKYDKERFNFTVKNLKHYLPFKDGFDFRKSFVLKMNEYPDFEKHYLDCLQKLGIKTKYQPFLIQTLN